MPDTQFCFTPEQAVSIIRLDRSSGRSVVYATGFLDGWLAGHAYTARRVLSATHAEQKRWAYATRHAPLPLERVLEATTPSGWHELEVEAVGWLQGWFFATKDADEALTCASCGRRLFEELEDPHFCKVNQLWGCNEPYLDCWRSFCGERGPGGRDLCRKRASKIQVLPAQDKRVARNQLSGRAAKKRGK